MEIPFEVKYLNIEWENKKNRLEVPSKIVESLFPVKIEKLNHNEYYFELQTYTKIENNKFGQPAIRISANNITGTPYIIDASNNQVPMKLIQNNNGNNWWIEDIIIKVNSKKVRGSQFHRQVGKSKIIIGNITCYIDIRAISFSIEELDFYLRDFKENFWKLIYKPDSFVDGNARQKDIKKLDEELLSLMSRFLKSCENILKNPKKELDEIQIYQDQKKVKPIPKTFQMIAIKGMSRKLPSRSYKEIFDISENRYILFIMKIIYSIIIKIISFQEREIHNILHNINTQELRKNSFVNIIKVKKENALYELERMENELKKIADIKECIDLQDNNSREQYEKKLNNQDINSILQSQLKLEPNNQLKSGIFEILLNQKLRDYKDKIQFSGQIKRASKEEWHTFGTNDLVSLKFDRNIFGFLQVNQKYYINTLFHYSTFSHNDGSKTHNIFFEYITELKPLNDSNTNHISYETINVIITKKYGNSQNKFLVNIKERNKPPRHFFVLELNNDIFGGKVYPGVKYKISGFVETIISEPNAKGNIEHKLSFKYVDSIDVIYSSLEQKTNNHKQDIQSLESQNWERPMTQSERIKQNQERNAIQSAIKHLNQEQTEKIQYIKRLEHIQNKMKKTIESFELLGIKESSKLPTSMTFIQNKNYKNIKKFYNEIKTLVGINEDIYSSLMLIEKIGLTDLPKLYERWTLLKIISILIEEYDFIPEKDWKENLVGQVITIKNDIKIKFYSDKLKKNITFWYEKKLSNGKRPDFVLDVESFVTDTNKRFIMDAKFKEREDISKLIEELYFKKNYSENGKNLLFIIHPDQSFIINNLDNSQDWSNQAYYGETELYNFEKDLPMHKYGAILLTPFNNEGYYLDNLKRLVSMFLQYGMEDNDKVDTINENEIQKTNSTFIIEGRSYSMLNRVDQQNNIKKKMFNPMINETPFCSCCGSVDLNIGVYITKHKKGFAYRLTCNDCQHVMEYNYCSSCQSRIIKNGRYWSYHASKAMEEFNIKCPHCGDYRLEEVE